MRSKLEKKRFCRQLLVNPTEYYGKYFCIPNTCNAWITVCCCFHDDKNPSLRINLQNGAYRCFGCGASGGDIVAFHQQKFQLNFIEAVNFFGAWHE